MGDAQSSQPELNWSGKGVIMIALDHSLVAISLESVTQAPLAESLTQCCLDIASCTSASRIDKTTNLDWTEFITDTLCQIWFWSIGVRQYRRRAVVFFGPLARRCVDAMTHSPLYPSQDKNATDKQLATRLAA